jgi:hypothetical protein
MTQKGAGRMFHDINFTVKSAKGKKLEQLIGVEDPDQPERGPAMIYIKLENASWSQYFLDVCFGVWENWGEIDTEDDAYVCPDYGKRFAVENKIIQSVYCKDSAIKLDFGNGEELTLKYKDPDEWESDTEIVYTHKTA